MNNINISQDLIRLLVEKYSPEFIILGGSCGMNMNNFDSDIDIIVVGKNKDKSFYSNEYHILFKTIPQWFEHLVPTYIENFLYCNNIELKKWLEQNIDVINRHNITKTISYKNNVRFLIDAYIVVSYYNYYFHQNVLRDIRSIQCKEPQLFYDILQDIKNTPVISQQEKDALLMEMLDIIGDE